MRRRVERSFPTIRAAYGFRHVLTEALTRKFAERLERQRDRGAATGDGGLERYISMPDFFLCIGRDIEKLRDALVRDDLALAAQRRVRRNACGRRDRRARGLYDALVRFKKEALKKLGKRRWRLAISLQGETHRDPVVLARQAAHAVSWASGPAAPLLGVDDRPVDWPAMAAPLSPPVDEVRAAIDVVAHEDALVTRALEARIWALRAFDKGYGERARALEATLWLAGLPTLAAAVRPHLKGAGRVGRPGNPVDAYPDLVERVRAAGLLPAAAPPRQATSAEADERHRLAKWIAAYRQVIAPYLSFLAGVSRLKPEGDDFAAGRRSAAAWPAKVLARWRGRSRQGED